MKTADAWVDMKDPNAKCLLRDCDFELPHYRRSEWVAFVRAIQADALKSAVITCFDGTVDAITPWDRARQHCAGSIRKLMEQF